MTQVQQEISAAPSLDERGVSIGGGTVRIKGHTFIARNITSVRAVYGRPTYQVGAVVSAVIGAGLFLGDVWALGTVALFTAVVLLIEGRSQLYLVTSSTETMALEARDAAFVRRVHDAVVAACTR